jgi:signal transduction histidine kinase
VQAWRAAALACGVELTLERPLEAIPVWGDRIRVAQATGNLIANALEHGEGDVAVRMRILGGCARVEFTDAGPGLPGPVATLARRRRRGSGERGRGLGIALAVAVGHGGRLAAAPTERGARIVLDLPLVG